MTINELLFNRHGQLYMGVLQTEAITVLTRSCWLLKISDCGLERPDRDVVMLERATDVMTEYGYWRVRFHDQHWWAHIVHILNIYQLPRRKPVGITVDLAVIPHDAPIPPSNISGCAADLVAAIGQHYYDHKVS